jgi:hypothetical protein
MLDQDSQERSVVIGDIPHDQAVDKLRNETDGVAFTGLDEAVIQFQKVSNYTTFTAEYSWVGQDLVMHFFLPPEKTLPADAKYWTEYFPRCLDAEARRFFNADHPRLIAKYTAEMASWWFRARGYAHILDPDAFAVRFLHELDRALDPNGDV